MEKQKKQLAVAFMVVLVAVVVVSWNVGTYHRLSEY